MNLNILKFCLRQGVVSLRRNFWLALVTAGMIAVSLAILGGFLLVALNVRQVMHGIAGNLEISVFLRDDADPGQIRNRLTALDGVRDFAFVPREQGLADFGRALGDSALFVDLAGETNPLPDMFRVRAGDSAQVEALAGQIQAFPGVEFVDYGKELVARLLSITRWLNALFLGVSSLLAASAVFLIVTIIRLSVMARQEEIGVMKYLGASNFFIRAPFFLEGMVMGWTGALAAAIAMGAVYQRLAVSLQREALVFFLQPVTDPGQLWPVFAGLLLMGTVMGGLGSLVSVRRFLRA